MKIPIFIVPTQKQDSGHGGTRRYTGLSPWSFISRWKEVLVITISIRLLLFVFGFLANGEQINNFFEIWVRWDGPHYIEIAQNGYQTTGEPALFVVFYPLYPLLIKFFALFLGNFSIAAIFTSTFFSIVAAIFLYELARLDEDKKTSLMAVWFLNIFPTSYFLQASYTESIFLTASIATVYFYRKNKSLVSGFFGAAATLTRVNGLLLIPILILNLKKIPQIWAIFLTFVGFLAYLAINFYLFGDPFYFTKPLSEHWYKHIDSPLVGINNLVSTLPPLASENAYILWSELISIPILFLLTILVFIKTRFSYGIYIALNFLLFISTSFILSTPRYMLILFPIYIALAKIRNSIIFLILNVISLGLLLILTFYYTSGRWAF